MKLIRERKTTVAIAALAVAAGLGACKKSDQYAADTAAARSDSAAGAMTPPANAMRTDTGAMARTDTGAMAGSANSAPANSDAAVLGFATAANNGEIALGQLGITKATNPAVKAFARRMVTDHKAMLADAKKLETKVGAMADTTANDAKDLMNHGKDEIKDLTDKAAGADWDKDYMNKMVDDHQKVLDKLQDAAKNNTNADVRAALEKATGKVQQHLTKAKDIVSNTLKS
jgi:putative membrane protein